jgi:hypothetical protein
LVFVVTGNTGAHRYFFENRKEKKLNELPLVEKGLSIPVPEGLLYLVSNRYKSFGTKVPPIVSLV